MLINKKDIIRINQEIGEEGEFSNESSLEFVISMVLKSRKSWLYELSYLIRALLVDPVFRDGNKRTALILTILYFNDRRIDYDRNKLLTTIHIIAKKNITDINRIMRMINNVKG